MLQMHTNCERDMKYSQWRIVAVTFSEQNVLFPVDEIVICNKSLVLPIYPCNNELSLIVILAIHDSNYIDTICISDVCVRIEIHSYFRCEILIENIAIGRIFKFGLIDG